MKLDPKNTVETLKQLKIQHIFNNPISTSAVISIQKNTDFRNDQNPKNTPLILVCKYAKSTPWASFTSSQNLSKISVSL